MAHQSYAKYAEIGRRLREIPLDGYTSSYEWEELVQKMCASDDTGLRAIGIRELGELKCRRMVHNEK